MNNDDPTARADEPADHSDEPTTRPLPPLPRATTSVPMAGRWQVMEPGSGGRHAARRADGQTVADAAASGPAAAYAGPVPSEAASAGVADDAATIRFATATAVVDREGSESAPADDDADEPAQPKTVWSRIGDWVLNILAAAGVLCIILVIAAFIGNYSLIMFKTGSMTPTIPQGSLALVKEIPASEIRVGDVVTVERPGELPVTHRVIEYYPQTGGEALIAMQGDANPNPDGGMYRVTEVRKVIGHVPGLARGVVWLSNPFVLGGITLSAALLVLWAFWPREPKSTRRKDDPTTADRQPDDTQTGAPQ